MLGTSITSLRLMSSKMAGDNPNTTSYKVLRLPPDWVEEQRKEAELYQIILLKLRKSTYLELMEKQQQMEKKKK